MENKNSLDISYTISNEIDSVEDFIRVHLKNLNVSNIIINAPLSEDFIREFKDKVDWNNVSSMQKLSEDFIREFEYKVNWRYISKYQKLSEDFIIEFKDKVSWHEIVKYQELSENLIRKFEGRLEWLWDISEYQKLSKDLIREFNLDINRDNWLYKDTEFKKQELMDTKYYECYDDYFIAYKAIRKDGYSFYIFNYKYEIGNSYESRADFTNDDVSFGLHAGSIDSAIIYGRHMDHDNFRIIKVKVYYKDIARVIKNRVRCTKLEVLEEVDTHLYK